MVKSQSKQEKNLTSKHLLNLPKDGFIQKKKNKKFKQIPTGKVPLISESKKSNSNDMKNDIPQKSVEKNRGLRKKDVEKLQECLKKQIRKKNFWGVAENESINEGIVLEDSDESNSSGGNKSEEEEILPDILGASLADDSDEDDEDYEEDKNVQVNKGVRMFDGVKSNDSIVSDEEDSMTEDNDEVDDDDEEDEGEEDTESENEERTDESSACSLQVLLGDSLSEDENDEEFAVFTDSSEIDDIRDKEDEKLKNKGSFLLKALLEDTIAEDDDDDEDFVEPAESDEDDDISDEADEEQEEEEVEGNKSLNSDQDKDLDKEKIEDFKENKRTIFVGNLPKDVTKKQLRKLFKQFGKIDAIRLRGKISKSLNIPKRVAAITNDLHPKVKSVYAYIRFESEESTTKALSINGTLFEGNYIRVDLSMKSNDKYEPKKSIFIGNLHFNVDDNSIRNHFKRCGEIESVRIIRDNQTGVGKGFGYVNFKSEDAVALAFELDGTIILNREIRVKPNIDQHKRTKEKHGKRSYPAENNRDSSYKKSKNIVEASVTNRNKENAAKRMTKKQKLEKKETSPQQQGNKFQGQKSDVNKKKSKNKVDKKKKLLAEKLMAKPKKPSN